VTDFFKHQKILLSGGSSGLGLALAHALAAAGAQLTLLARDAGKLAAAVADIRRRQPAASVQGLAVDITDAAALSSAVAQAAQEMNGIDILINNAGILREGYFQNLSDADFRDVMETNFHSAVNLTRLALPHLKKSRGRLVNIASVAGLTGSFGYTPYSAAKHALVGFTECLQYELPPLGVQVHLVCPAEFDSPMVDALDQTRTPENRAHTLTIPKTGVDVIVKGTLDGIRRGESRIVPGTRAWLATVALRLFPGLSRRVGQAVIRRTYRGPESSGVWT
jgi:3-dehydrosphinganine reductase